MKKTALFAGLALAASTLVAAPAFAASPADGKWAVEAKTDFGVFKSNWTVAADDESISLEVVDAPVEGFPAPGGGTISEIKLEGHTLTFKRQINFGDMPITLNYTATFDGDKMTGVASSDFGPTPISGVRE